MMYARPLLMFLYILECQCAVLRLYTLEGGFTNGFLLTRNISKLKETAFDGKRKTVVLIHGFTQSHTSSWVIRLREKLQRHEKVNVITTDWSDKAKVVLYPAAAKSTRSVGNEVADLVAFLVRHAPSSADMFHVVGFSLGAHAAGFAGLSLKNMYGLKLGRITGLDPAGPLFNSRKLKEILDPTDAAFVDVIHTCLGKLPNLGISRRIGHVDFYPNGGSHQSGCGSKLGPSRFSCDHSRAAEYFIESVSRLSSFLSYPCQNLQDFDRGRCLQCSGGQCPSMGYYADRTKGQASGKHYLYTNKSPPFSAYHYLLKFETSTEWKKGLFSLSKIFVKITGSQGIDTGEVELKSFHRRRVHQNSTENFVMPSPVDVGDLQRIQVRISRTGFIIYDRWFLLRVVAKPAWSDQQYTAFFNMTWKGTLEEKFSTG